MPIMTPKDRPATERDIALNLAASDPSWTEAMGANMGAAWDWLPGRTLWDRDQLARAEREEYGVPASYFWGGGNPYDPITQNRDYRAYEEKRRNIPKVSQDEWKESEDFREGIEWDDSMTPVSAKILAEQYDERRARDKILARQTTAQKVAGFGVQMGVGLADPVNYIPFLGQAAKLKMIARFGAVGGRMLASGIEAGAGNLLFNPVVGADLERRGEEITMADYAVDTMLGAGVGMLFGGAAGTWAKHFRGETKDAVLRALQKGALDIEDGRPVDVGPILKDVVEAGQFNRATAARRLTDAGIGADQAEVFLGHLDGLAAAQGMDADSWLRRHVADIDVGGTDGEGIRFHAAMYRNEASNLPEFLENARENVRGKQSYYELGELPDALSEKLGFKGQVAILSDAVRHVDKRHPGQSDDVWRRVPDTLSAPDDIRTGNQRKARYGRSAIVIKRYGDKAHAVAVEVPTKGKRGRAYVTTSFEDNYKNVLEWAARQESKEEVRMGAGGNSGISPIPDGRSHVNTSSKKTIHHGERVRKAVERLQRRSKNAAPLHVVATMDDLPEHIRSRARERGIDRIDGVSDGRTVYLVADALESESQAVALWMHEQGVHRGLRGLVGDDARFNSLMDAVFEHFGPEELDGIRQQYGLDFGRASHRREAAEEMLARVGEKIVEGGELSNLEQSLWERIRAWFADFLRGHGVDVEMSDADIARIVKDAVRWTMDGPPTIGRGGPQRFSVKGRGNGAVEFLPDGRALVRLFDGADPAEAGEGLSRILAERFGEHAPAERLDWRVERPERGEMDLPEGTDADEAFARDAEDVRRLAEAGRLTDEDLAEIRTAERGVEESGRIAKGFRAAVECIITGGM